MEVRIRREPREACPRDRDARAARAVIAATVAATVAWADEPALAASSDDSPSVVPYRPSVSTPAALSAPGWLEVEGGVQREHDSAGARRDSLPLTFKLAFTPDWGVIVAGDAWVRQRDDGGAASGIGDVAMVLKRRFAIDDESAFGLEAAALVPTSRHGLGEGSGKPDWGAKAIYSADFGAWHCDLNAAATRLGAPEAGTGRAEVLGAASLSRTLGSGWGFGGEVSTTHRSGVDNTRQLLGAASYSVSKRLVVDAGAARSSRGSVKGWSAFTGFTWLAGQVF